MEVPSLRQRHRSPYEDQPIHEDNLTPSQSPLKKPVLRSKNDADGKQKRKQHKRGSDCRHTLGVDVAWLKKLVINKHFTPSSQNKVVAHPSGSTDAVDELVSPVDLEAIPSYSQNL